MSSESWWSRTTKNASRVLDESWPLLLIGIVGGAFFFGGLALLVFGW